MKLQLITLEGLKLDDDIYEVMLPTASGPIAVYPGHEPLVTLAVPGVITVRRNKSDADNALEVFAANGGVVEISPDRVRVLVDDADRPDDIVEAEAEKALAAAQAMKANAKNQIELDKAQAMIDRSAVRLKVAGLRRRSR